MSQLLAHVKSHRALARALAEESASLAEASNEQSPHGAMHCVSNALLLNALATAHRKAADELERQINEQVGG